VDKCRVGGIEKVCYHLFYYLLTHFTFRQENYTDGLFWLGPALLHSCKWQKLLSIVNYIAFMVHIYNIPWESNPRPWHC